MFDLKYVLLIILLSVAIYLVYNLYSSNSRQLDKFRENIVDEIEVNLDDINEKLDNIYELVDSKITVCNSKIKDLYSLQNKMNEITKMNNQSIINQINQYDDAGDELDDLEKNQVFNSLENSAGPNSYKNTDRNTDKNNCFIKLNDVKPKDLKNKDVFYMSPHNNLSSTSKVDSLINKTMIANLSGKESASTSNNESISNINQDLSDRHLQNPDEKLGKSKPTKKNKKVPEQIIVQNINVDKDTENSTVLEITDNFIKTNCIRSNTPKANSAYKILNESSNILFNSSNDLFNLNNKSNFNKSMDDLSSHSTDNSDLLCNDPEVILKKLIGKQSINAGIREILIERIPVDTEETKFCRDSNKVVEIN